MGASSQHHARGSLTEKLVQACLDLQEYMRYLESDF